MTTADVRDARRIFIVGAGGFGREVLAWARNAWPEASAKVAGFLAEERGMCCLLPIVASPASFAPGPDDALVLAIGIPDVRRRVAESLLARGGLLAAGGSGEAIVGPVKPRAFCGAGMGAECVLLPSSAGGFARVPERPDA